MQRVIERILNLLAYLLTVGRPVTADEIRYTVAGYDDKSDVAFHRTFERDKKLLLAIGVPLKLVATDIWEVDQGYRVVADEYALDDPGLTDDERAALWVASRIARMGSETTPQTALLKLGGADFEATGEPLSADLGADPEVLGDLFGAIVDRRIARFTYRAAPRRVQPLGLVHRLGHWYLVARVGTEDRNFRVDRITELVVDPAVGGFTRPAGFSASKGVPQAPWDAGDEAITAAVRFDPELAWWVRRQVGHRGEILEQPDGALLARIPVSSPEAFIGWIIGFDDRAEILEPADLRGRLVSHLGGAV